MVGLFDFEDAGIGHRYEDLRYLHSCGRRFLDRALDAYEAGSGVSIDRERLGRFHLHGAFRHFVSVPPDNDRFPRIIEWTDAAIRHFWD
ncbi:MAG: phosphotransferase [Myxococcota bacterium]